MLRKSVRSTRDRRVNSEPTVAKPLVPCCRADRSLRTRGYAKLASRADDYSPDCRGESSNAVVFVGRQRRREGATQGERAQEHQKEEAANSMMPSVHCSTSCGLRSVPQDAHLRPRPLEGLMDPVRRCCRRFPDYTPDSQSDQPIRHPCVCCGMPSCVHPRPSS